MVYVYDFGDKEKRFRLSLTQKTTKNKKAPTKNKNEQKNLYGKGVQGLEPAIDTVAVATVTVFPLN